MKSVNKIIILFFLIIGIAFYGIWEFLQSEFVALRISKIATTYAEKVLNSDIEFESLRFNLFPPGADLKEVRIKGQKNGLEFSAEVNNFGLYFNPIDVLSTSFSVNEVRFEDGYLKLKLPSSGNKENEKSRREKKKKSKTNLVDQFKILESIPVNTVVFKDYLIEVNDNQLETTELEINNGKSYIETSGVVSNIDVTGIVEKMIHIDSVSFSATITPQRIVAQKLNVKKDLGVVDISGKIENYLSKNISYDLKSNVKLPLMMINDIVDFSKVGRIYAGDGEIDVKIQGTKENYDASVSVLANNVDSDFAYGEKLKALLKVNNKQIVFQKMSLRVDDQQVELQKPFEFFNLETKKWVEEPVVVKATKLKTDNFLRFLKDSLSLIDGRVSGEIRFVLGENYYTFMTGEDVRLDYLELKPGGTKIFSLSELKLDYGKFNVEDGVFSMDLIASDGNTTINLNGEIGKDKFLLQMPPSNFDLAKVSPIVNFNIQGDGKLGFKLQRMSDKKLKMFLNGDFKDLKFEKYSLDTVKTDLIFDFQDNTISIDKLRGTSNQAQISAKGLLNYKDLSINTDFSISKMNFTELKRILKDDLGDLQLTSNEIHGVWDLDGKISGKMNKENLILDGSFKGFNNYFFNESLDTFKFRYQLKDMKFFVKDFVAKKASGKLYSFFEYDIEQEAMSLWLKISDLPISELSYYSKTPLALQGAMNGSVKLNYLKSKWNGEGTFFLEDSNVLATSYRDSSLNILIKDSKFSMDLNGFGKQIQLKTDIDLADYKTPSLAKLNLDISDIKKMFGIFKGVDVSNTNLKGRIKYGMETQFYLDKFRFQKITSHLEEFELQKKPISVSYTNNKPEIVVEDGEIKKWDVNVRGRKFYILSKGKGDFKDIFDVTSNLKIDASIIEIFNSIISKANGNLRGKLVYRFDGEENHYEALLTSNNLSLNSKYMPTAVTKADLRISFLDSHLKIEKFLAKLVTGSFELKGDINLKRVVPEIDLRYSFNDAGLSIMKKSNLIFSGNGSFIGKTFPYTLGGDFYIQKFNLVNELSDFGGGESSIISQNDIKYLPDAKKKAIENLLDLNLNVVTREPIFITNSVADLGFLGNIQVSGGEKDPKLSGKISLAPRKNRITFKNNEFVFSKGNVFFVERNDYKNPELDFLATSQVGEYKINVKLLGPVKNFDMNLYSEPVLPQADILSLIAFGYTEDLSNNLTDQDRESMTRASIGSILFDSFKINETLKKEFGLQVNLGTDIEEEERSLISQRTGEGFADGRVRSATTLEVKKSLSNSMSLSVSSTVGENTQQRQSVNLNYNVNKKVSLEGVYENRSTDETQTIVDETSVGADINVKWTFK